MPRHGGRPTAPVPPQNGAHPLQAGLYFGFVRDLARFVNYVLESPGDDEGDRRRRERLLPGDALEVVHRERALRLSERVQRRVSRDPPDDEGEDQDPRVELPGRARAQRRAAGRRAAAARGRRAGPASIYSARGPRADEPAVAHGARAARGDAPARSR